MTPTKALLLLFTAGAAACSARVGPGEAGYPYNVRGAYAGRLLVDDRPFEAALSLRTASGGGVAGSLRVLAPVAMDGAVRGRVVDDLLRITVTYVDPDGCEGRIEGILDVARGGEAVEGPVTISGCGEPVAGRLDFRRGGDGDHPPRSEAPSQ